MTVIGQRRIFMKCVAAIREDFSIVARGALKDSLEMGCERS